MIRARSRMLAAGCLLAVMPTVSLNAQQPPASGKAQAPAAAPKPRFQPPPVPGFMLQRPDKPLTREEMIRQADEAAARVRQPNADPAKASREENKSVEATETARPVVK